MTRPVGRPPGSYGRFSISSEGLYLGSAPLEHRELDIDRVDEHRRLLCRRYENCLTFAASEGWRGFSCRGCSIEETLSAQDQKRDLDGLATFLAALNLPIGWRRE